MITCEEYERGKLWEDHSKSFWEDYASKGRSGGMCLSPPWRDPGDNEARALLEEYEFHRDKPERYIAYWHLDQRINAAVITAWTGIVLARVTWSKEHTCYGFGGFPQKRVNFRCITEDGIQYAGTYYKSAGDYVRMRRVKGGK